MGFEEYRQVKSTHLAEWKGASRAGSDTYQTAF
jgi:hypothetical protein